VTVQPQHPLAYTAGQRLAALVEDRTFARLCRSRDFLAANLDQPMRLEDAAGAACLSAFHFHRMFARR
jgi:transcriptional regulator GlxA family with amidase domain